MLKQFLERIFNKTSHLAALEIETTVYFANGEILTERRPIQEL